MTNHIFIFGEIGQEVNLMTVSGQIDKSATDILLHIHSQGGLVDEGFAIYDFLKSQNKPIRAVIEGMCYSIATVIALSAKEIEIQPHAKILMHYTWTSATGNAVDLTKIADDLKKEDTKLANFYSNHLGIDEAKARDIMSKEVFLSAEEAIQIGFANNIVVPTQSVAKINQNKIIMELSKEDRTLMQSVLSSVKSLFVKHKINAMMPLKVVTGDGEKTVYVETEDGEFEGKKVFTDEAMTTPLAEGEHALSDGRKITVEGGTITAVSEVEDSAELEKAKSENEALKKDGEEKAKEIAALKKDMVLIQAKFNDMAKIVLAGEKKPAKAGSQSITNGKETAREMAMRRAAEIMSKNIN